MKQISKAYLSASENNKKHESPIASKVNVLLICVFSTVSIGSTSHYLDNE